MVLLLALLCSMICNDLLAAGDKVEKVHNSQSHIPVLINKNKIKNGIQTASNLNNLISVSIDYSPKLLFTTLNAKSVKNKANAIFNLLLRKELNYNNRNLAR